MNSPVATVFGKTKQKQMDLDRPEGCDHDQSVYHYRLVDGAMVLRGIALGPRWESRQMDWRGLSCYKEREDEQMALITKESGRPEPIANRAELMAKAKGLIAGGMSQRQAAKELGIVENTLSGWLTREKKRNEKTKAKYEEILDSVDAVQPIRSMGCIEPEPELQYEATEVATAPIGVEVPKTSPLEYCCSCGELLSVMRVWVENKVYCFDCYQKLRGYKPTDNDFQAEDEEWIPCQVAETFDACRFKLEVIENIIEMSGLRHAPKEITLEMISGIIGS